MKTRQILVTVIVVILVIFGTLTATAIETRASDGLLSEEELTKILEGASTEGDLSYIPLDNYYYEPKVGYKKVRQIVNAFLEKNSLKLESLELDKDFDSHYLYGIYIVHSPK